MGAMIDPASRIRRAVHLNDVTLLKRIILNNPTYIRIADEADEGNSVLHLAAKLGRVEIVDFLVKAGHEATDISRNANHDTPLHVAVAASHDSVAYLLAVRFPHCIPYQNLDGADAIMLAARGTPALFPGAGSRHATLTAGTVSTPGALSKAGSALLTPLTGPKSLHGSSAATTPGSIPDMTATTPGQSVPGGYPGGGSSYFPHFTSNPAPTSHALSHVTSNSSLNSSAITNNTNKADLLSTLLTLHPHPLPIPLEATDHVGNTPLHYATAYGALKSIRTLLELGANPETRNKFGWVPESFSASVAAEVYYKNLVSQHRDRTSAANAAATPPISGTSRSRSGSSAAAAMVRGKSGSAGSTNAPTSVTMASTPSAPPTLYHPHQHDRVRSRSRPRGSSNTNRAAPSHPAHPPPPPPPPAAVGSPAVGGGGGTPNSGVSPSVTSPSVASDTSSTASLTPTPTPNTSGGGLRIGGIRRVN